MKAPRMAIHVLPQSTTLLILLKTFFISTLYLLAFHARVAGAAATTATGEITGPIGADVPIRLAKNRNPSVTNRNKDWNLKSNPNPNQNQNYYSSSSSTAQAQQQQQHEQTPSTKLKITAPPDGSYVAGSNVYVSIDIMIPNGNPDAFYQEYGNDPKICLTVDAEKDGKDDNSNAKNMWYCWPIESRIMLMFHQGEDEMLRMQMESRGVMSHKHSLIAALCRDGELMEETMSESIRFTNIIDLENPLMVPPLDDREQEEEEYEDNQEEEDNEIDLDLDEIDSEKLVEVAFPSIRLRSPLDRVSYTGSKIPLQSYYAPPKNPHEFRKYFRHSFTCFRIDLAIVHACFPLFPPSANNSDDGAHDTRESDFTVDQSSEDDPLILGLAIGMHTIEASLSTPDNEQGGLLPASSSGTFTFFMAGDVNEGAAFMAEINLRGTLYRIPIVRGGCLVEQTRALCGSIGLGGDEVCLESVFHHLHMVATQTGFTVLEDATVVLNNL